jgi:phosphotriesterase-related protein
MVPGRLPPAMSDELSGAVTVNTTAGPVEPSQLGRIMVHEHLTVFSEALRVQFPHAFSPSEEFAAAIAAVRAMQRYGVTTLCDPTCMNLGRDARMLLDVAAETGMTIIAATGIYPNDFASLPLHIRIRETDYLADLFVHDLTVGIQETPLKAHFIKVAADHPGLTADVEMLHRAAARASLATGAPIMAHSSPAHATGLAQMQVFVEEGVPPRKVHIAHTGDTEDLEYIERLLETGCCIGMDRYCNNALSAARRNAVVIQLCARGYGDRMALGQDAVATLHGLAGGSITRALPIFRASHSYLFEEVLPDLEARGLEKSEIDAMLGKNVLAWLTA